MRAAWGGGHPGPGQVNKRSRERDGPGAICGPFPQHHDSARKGCLLSHGVGRSNKHSKIKCILHLNTPYHKSVRKLKASPSKKKKQSLKVKALKAGVVGTQH